MYKILTGNSIIYDSTNKYDYPVVSPVANLELGEAGNLEFTILPGHPLHDKINEMQTFVAAYQDDELFFDGRVLQAEEDIYGQVQVTCEGALTFLLDSEMEPGTYTETIAEFFKRCIQEHNSQVETAKRFAVGNVQCDEEETKLEFKLEGYNTTRQVLDNLLIGKHGGFLSVRYQNGSRYLDYIQHYENKTNQQIKIGYNVIDRTRRVSGENMFTILRPLGKNNLTIEGASSENLLVDNPIVRGKYLGEGGGDRIDSSDSWLHSDFISVMPDTKYIYGPCEMKFVCYDANQECMTVLEPGTAFEVTFPTSVEGFENPVAYTKLVYPKEYDSKIVFKLPGTNLIDMTYKVEGKMLTYVDHNIKDPNMGASDYSYDGWEDYEELSHQTVDIPRERVQKAEGWNYNSSYIIVRPGQKYLATPGLVSVNFYKTMTEDNTGVCFAMYRPEGDLGGDVFTIPENTEAMRVSYTNRFGAAMRIERYNDEDNLATRLSGAEGKLRYCRKEKEYVDVDWCYATNFIPVEGNKYYTGGPSPIKACFFDEKHYFISFDEANRSGLTMHYIRTPEAAKYMKVSFLLEFADEQQIQKGKALILTKLDKGTKTILIPDRIAKYGQIIHSETFSEIGDAQELYNAAIEWLSLHHSVLPKSLDTSIVDFHLLNPKINKFEIGDVYDNIEGFSGEAMTIGSITKDMENPANDSITLKNFAELMGPDAGKSSGSLSSKYAGSGGGSGSGGGTNYPHIQDDEDGAFFGITGVKDIAIKALESLELSAPQIKLLAEETDKIKAQIDIIAKGKDGTQSSISLTDSAVAINSENIVLEAKNIYNIADNVVTIADSVFTHANLIWNEAKDIVTIANSIYVLTDHLTVVADTIDIIANDINILANNIRITMREMDGLRAYLELTASHLRTEFYDDLNSMRSYLELTASHLRTEFYDDLNGLRSYLELTASHLRTEFYDDLNSMRSYLELTASHLRTEFYDDLNSMRSYFELTASHLRAEFYSDINSMRSYLELTASHLRTEFYDDLNGLRSYLELTASHLSTEFQDDMNSLRSYFELTASHLRTEFHDDVGSLRSYLDIQAGKIEMNVAATGENSSILRQAGLSINDQGVLIYATDNENNIGSKLNVLSNEISAKVGKSEVVITEDSITIGSDTISFEGYVKIEELEAEIASLDHVIGDFDVAGSVNVGGTLGAGAIESEGMITAASLSLNGYTLSSSMISDMDNAVIGFGNATSSGGQISIPYTTIGGSGTINFNIADTKFYQDNVSAAAANEEVAHVNTIGLSRSDTGTVDKAVTALYTSGKSGTITVPINAALVYAEGRDVGYAEAVNKVGRNGDVVSVPLSNGESGAYEATINNLSYIQWSNPTYIDGIAYYTQSDAVIVPRLSIAWTGP